MKAPLLITCSLILLAACSKDTPAVNTTPPANDTFCWRCDYMTKQHISYWATDRYDSSKGYKDTCGLTQVQVSALEQKVSFNDTTYTQSSTTPGATDTSWLYHTYKCSKK